VGPTSLAKHPLYTSVALLVLPWMVFYLTRAWEFLIGAVLIHWMPEYSRLKKKRHWAKAFGAIG